MKLKRGFYNRDTLVVAKELLGKVLTYEINGNKLSGIIVEVEAYKGLNDKAAHSYHGKITDRVKVMYGDPGYAYIFMIYGMYYCMNVVTREKNIPEAILIRGVEPIEGLDNMSKNRFNKTFSNLNKREKIRLTNGPGKLSMAFSIDKSNNGDDLCGDKLYIEEGTSRKFTISQSSRIGIDYAQEAKDYPYRFFIQNNPYVSR